MTRFRNAGPAIRSLSLQRRRPTPFGLGVAAEHLVALLCYALALQQCFNTVGQPYAAAVAHAAHRASALQTATAAALASLPANATAAPNASWGTAYVAPPAAPEVDPWDPWAEEEAPVAAAAAPKPAAAAATASFGGALEEEEEKEPPLPSQLLPAFWAMLLLASVALLHVLSQLAQHWSMRLRVAARYTPAAVAAPGCLLLVQPPEHQGRPDLVPLREWTRADGSRGLFFLFQRQRYELEAVADAPAGPEWEVCQLPYPVAQPLAAYLASPGLAHGEVADVAGSLRARFGRNDFHVPVPTLPELFKEQLLGPVTQFQLFSALLWIMDEYWKYALFNGGMILVFEATTAFSRLRSLQTLRGMGHKARTVHVLRGGAWGPLSSDELLPGDVISLVKGGPEDDCVVPVDCLLLAGAAVANEASLTGESVPQMKEAVRPDDAAAGVALDMASRHRIHVLCSGTTLMQHAGERDRPPGSAPRPPPPDGGCVAFVLRTGFASSQGALMRMIEFSQEQVTGDSRETLVLLLILLVFALLSAGHVLRTGLAEGKRSQYELLLRCVFILTTVVPPELPMQTALAVNTSLMALHKAGVFCTEPYRIPLAGKVDACLFDKTGTLTTDKLVAQGVVCAAPPGQALKLAAAATASLDACLVLAGCHSLLEIDGQLLGDPIEVAALAAIDWQYDPASCTARPGGKRDPATRPWAAGLKPELTILQRYHFASALQRMSVLARVSGGEGPGGVWALVKGSPEAVGALLATTPPGYDDMYRHMAERGLRVLALAAKTMPPQKGGWEGTPRDAVESGLRFVAFLAFSCRVRNDSAAIVARLRAGGTQVSMVTGDAALTALHVAREVGICDHTAAAEEPLLLTLPDEAEGAAGLQWVSARRDASGAEKHRLPFSAAGVPALARKHDLVVTGAALRAAAAAEPAFWKHMAAIRVLARMAPEDKEAVLKALRANGRHTLMCGDGANDVGALKQAHVGLALLAGFGNANAKTSDIALLEEEGEAEAEAEGGSRALSLRKKKQEEEAAAAAKAAELKAKQDAWRAEAAGDKAEMLRLQQMWVQEEMERLKESCKYPMVAAVQATQKRLQAHMAAKNAERMARYGGNIFAPEAVAMQGMLDGLEEGELPRVKLGDASIAAPFTSKAPSICSVVDIVRQGRCALVNTAQQQQILALNCLISAYSLSALYLDGIKSGEAQMIATGILLTVASLAFSFTHPVQELSPVPPLRSIFHPAYSLSLVGQLLIHLGCMVYSFRLAKLFEPDGPGSCAACVTAPTLAELNPNGFLAQLSAAVEKELAKQDDPDAPPKAFKFTPSLLNTVVFLVTTAQQVSVMFVNYKGRPFMQGITENPAFLYSVLLCCGGAFACAFERVPELNAALKLVSMPNDAFRWSVLKTLALSTVGAFLWDRLCLAVFAPHILRAALNAAYDFDPAQMMRQTVRQFKVVFTVVTVLGTGGSLWSLLGVYWLYKRGFYDKV